MHQARVRLLLESKRASWGMLFLSGTPLLWSRFPDVAQAANVGQAFLSELSFVVQAVFVRQAF